MNKTQYYDYNFKKLNYLAYLIESSGKLNILNIHIHSENFYLELFNLLFKYELENLNQIKQNVPAIDLIDYKNKLVIQVSATCTKEKIESALKKDIISQHSDYRFKFISISKDASNLTSKQFKNPHSISFNPEEDIYDIHSILNVLLIKSTPIQKEIYNFIKGELGNEIDSVKLDSNLAYIINILADEEWDDINKTDYIDEFEIERKINHNELVLAKGIIEEYSVYSPTVTNKYQEFDKFGSNKSNSVLAAFKREYLYIKDKTDADLVYSKIVENIKIKILESANFTSIPVDELDYCIDILVVDAFIRCKIFKNPKEYKYVVA